MMRLAGKIAVVVGAGQSPGEGIGNGRATVLPFAQDGAKTLVLTATLPQPRRRSQYRYYLCVRQFTKYSLAQARGTGAVANPGPFSCDEPFVVVQSPRART